MGITAVVEPIVERTRQVGDALDTRATGIGYTAGRTNIQFGLRGIIGRRETGMAAKGEYAISKEEAMRMAELAGMEFDEDDAEEILDETFAVYECERVKAFLNEMANVAFSATGDEFTKYAFENRGRIRDMAWSHPEVAEMLVLGYKVGIANGSGACMNDLGALYYMGDLIEQDYAKAADLYEMAANAGCYQSIINLGYIYEYGRTGKPDHAKAYQWYSLAAALAPSCEAVYKLGDMFSRGKAVPRDRNKAYRLYERSLELACNAAQYSQPALRIAKMLIDSEGPSYGVDPDPLRALGLFQQAEIGLRIDIADGQTYYAKRLRETIEGQGKARALVEADNDIIID